MFKTLTITVAICITCAPLSTSAQTKSQLIFSGQNFPIRNVAYRFGDRPIEKYTDRQNRALSKYPTLRSCLTVAFDGNFQAETFDWSQFYNEDEVSVCVFRIAAVLDNPDVVSRWLASQGFQLKPLLQYSSPRESYLSASWNAKQFLKYRSNSWSYIIQPILPWPTLTQNVGLSWDGEGRLIRVTTGETRW